MGGYMRRKLNESIQIHDELNPRLFDTNGELFPEVREALLRIRDFFLENTEIPIKVLETHLVGSNASFNYTEHSDIDLHLVVNFDSIPAPKDLIQAYFNGERSSFNRAHKIKIKGLDVELYLEDVNANTMSNGIYNVDTDCWIKYPQKIRDVKIHNTEHLVSDWVDRIQQAFLSNDLESVQNTIDALYLMRKNSIVEEGEYGMGNQVFKDIRNLGLLDKLKDSRDELITKRLTLESFTENYFTGDLFRMKLD
jgi:predicted nucleotidyltransferase